MNNTQSYLILTILMLALLVPAVSFTADGITENEGIIEAIDTYVRGGEDKTVIVFSGQRIDITDVRVVRPNGKELEKDVLQVGRQAEIFYRNGKIIYILMHEKDEAR